MKWTKTVDELPPENKAYLCIKATPTKIFEPYVALYARSMFKFLDCDGEEVVPTHWAEIDLSELENL